MEEADKITLRECTLCRDSIIAKIEASNATHKAELTALRREIVLASSITTTLTGIFIALFGLYLTYLH